MGIYSIYRVTNIINNKVYIGFTSKRLCNRKSQHKHHAFSDTSDNKFYNAIRKYGWENFIWDVIYQSKEDCSVELSHTLTVMEDLFIQEYNSILNGYNTINGGGNLPIMRGKDHPLYGIGHSPETKRKISKNHHNVTGPNNPRARNITIIDVLGNEYHAHGNLPEVCKSLNMSTNSIYTMLSQGKTEFVRGKLKGYRVFYSS